MTFNSKPPTILIVDDMPINIQILARALKATYGIKIATRGEKALEIAAGENPPDLILLDIMMPEMDGYEVIRRLKGDEATRNIPVISLRYAARSPMRARVLIWGRWITLPNRFNCRWCRPAFAPTSN